MMILTDFEKTGDNAQKNNARTPLGNTGFNCQAGAITPMIHWVQGVTITRDLKPFVKFITDFTRGEVVWKWGQGRFKGRYWDNTVMSTCGAMWLYNKLESGFYRIWFSISGSALERMSLDDSRKLITGLSCHYQVGFTRIDAKIRVPSWLISPAFAWEQGVKGNFSGVKKLPSETTSFASDGYKSQTVYFGSSDSDSRTRIYDPREKHKVEGCTDIEAQLNDGKAIAFAQIIADLPVTCSSEDFAQIVASAAVGQITFIDRSSGQRAARCPVLAQWAKLLDWIGGSLKIYAGRAVKSFDKVKAWFSKQVAPSLSALGNAFGDDAVFAWVWDELVRAKTRVSPELNALVLEVHNQGQVFD